MPFFSKTYCLVVISKIFKKIENSNSNQVRQQTLRCHYTKFKLEISIVFLYEGCSNMNASGFITFLTYMLRQNSKRFYKGLYVTFKVAPDLKKNTVYLSSYSPLNEGHVCILTNSMLRTYTSDRDERIILLRKVEIS